MKRSAKVAAARVHVELVVEAGGCAIPAEGLQNERLDAVVA